MADRRRRYRDYALLAGSLAGIIAYVSLTTESRDGWLCPKPSGRSVENLFAPCQLAEMRLAELQPGPTEPGHTLIAGIRQQLFGDLSMPPRTDLAKAASEDVTATGSIGWR